MFSEEAIKKISEGRKKWLSENPDKHPWRKKDKFVSVPCEHLKENLKKEGIDFIEEAIVTPDKNYSVDILIKSKKLIIEVNGNQHYDKDGKLNPYYQERHDYITSLGWKVIELHYTLAYNIELCLNLIKNEPDSSVILPFKIREKKNKKYGSREKYFKSLNDKYEDENMKLIPLIKNSEIDFSKFGWVNKVAKIINQKPQKVNVWMKRFMPDFYESECFKKKNKQ